ncbi:hypothetical protein NIES4102_17990 [Chondrocystis sp. NIES-4102]|nr:hypothetical protein NIES4102_17990 [Chondrocystis sp. NIES-4102]
MKIPKIPIGLRGMVWHPEKKDSEVNEYLEETNQAPYPTIAGILVVAFCLLTVVIFFAMV